MAREAVKVELTNNTGFPRRYTVADTPAITKGTILQLTDPRTASAHSGAIQSCAGIAAMDKEASDGALSITAWTDGIFELYASGAITVGDEVVLDAVANYVKSNTPAGVKLASGAAVIGYALETASTGEVINVRVKL